MGEFIVTMAWGVLGCATVGFLACLLIGRWAGDIPTHKPKPIKVAIEELSAHKMQHQSWVEGQRLAMEWWEQQCACPSVKDYRQIPGCKQIAPNGVCIEFMTGEAYLKENAFNQDLEDWRWKQQYRHFRTGSALWLEEQRRVHERMH